MKVGAQPAAFSGQFCPRAVDSLGRGFYLPALNDCPIV